MGRGTGNPRRAEIRGGKCGPKYLSELPDTTDWGWTANVREATLLSQETRVKPSRNRPECLSTVQESREILQALAGRSSQLVRALQFVFRNRGECPSFQDLRVPPILGTHLNIIKEKPFILLKERF